MKFEATAIAVPESSWDFLLPEEIGHEIEPLQEVRLPWKIYYRDLSMYLDI